MRLTRPQMLGRVTHVACANNSGCPARPPDTPAEVFEARRVGSLSRAGAAPLQGPTAFGIRRWRDPSQSCRRCGWLRRDAEAIRACPERHARRPRLSRQPHGSLQHHLRACASAPARTPTALANHEASNSLASRLRNSKNTPIQRLRVFITRSTSRFPSRSLMVSRLSCSALPLARAISHFTLPAFQCRLSGTRV